MGALELPKTTQVLNIKQFRIPGKWWGERKEHREISVLIKDMIDTGN